MDDLSSSHTSVCFIVEIHLLLFLVFGNMFDFVFVFLILWVSRILFISFFSFSAFQINDFEII